jgi:hypothetical protein
VFRVLEPGPHAGRHYRSPARRLPCWAIDDNLTRWVSAGDALQFAAIEGLVAGAGSLAHGLLGYGVNLVLFVRALRELGTARTGACFRWRPSPLH